MQLLALLAFLVIGIFYVVVRRGFEATRVRLGRPRSIRWILGALAIAFVWIIDDLFACETKSCDPEFLSALRLERISLFVYLFYLHLLFTFIEVFFFLWTPGSASKPGAPTNVGER